jgi:hypothetical protein
MAAVVLAQLRGSFSVMAEARQLQIPSFTVLYAIRSTSPRRSQQLGCHTVSDELDGDPYGCSDGLSS